MKTFWGSLRHLFASANRIQMLWGIAILLVMLILAILHHVWRDDDKKLGRWRWLCLLPLLICIAHFFLNVFGAMDLLGGFIPLYLLGIIGLLPMFTAKRRIGHRIMLVPVTLLTALCGLYYCASAPNFFNYSSMRYTESFRAAVKTMDEYYVLKEWKEVDFAALEAKYLPAVEAAEREQNPAKFEEAVTSFCNELHDGHVWVGAGYDFDAYNIDEDKHGFGLATIRTDSGEVIAINTEESVQALGIQDGTVLTKMGRQADRAGNRGKCPRSGRAGQDK